MLHLFNLSLFWVTKTLKECGKVGDFSALKLIYDVFRSSFSSHAAQSRVKNWFFPHFSQFADDLTIFGSLRTDFAFLALFTVVMQRNGIFCRNYSNFSAETGLKAESWPKFRYITNLQFSRISYKNSSLFIVNFSWKTLLKHKMTFFIDDYKN